MSRYHPLLVALHWLLAIMIVGLLFAGEFVLTPVPNADPGKVDSLRMHMIGGAAVLFLMTGRWIVRAATRKPEHAKTGNAALDRIGVWAHWLFYPLVILMAVSGFGIAFLAGLPEIVFGGSGDPLPPDFSVYPPRIAHGLLAKLLLALIVLHVAAALRHQFALKDRLLSRMWFGKRA